MEPKLPYPTGSLTREQCRMVLTPEEWAKKSADEQGRILSNIALHKKRKTKEDEDKRKAKVASRQQAAEAEEKALENEPEGYADFYDEPWVSLNMDERKKRHDHVMKERMSTSKPSDGNRRTNNNDSATTSEGKTVILHPWQRNLRENADTVCKKALQLNDRFSSCGGETEVLVIIKTNVHETSSNSNRLEMRKRPKLTLVGTNMRGLKDVCKCFKELAIERNKNIPTAKRTYEYEEFQTTAKYEEATQMKKTENRRRTQLSNEAIRNL